MSNDQSQPPQRRLPSSIPRDYFNRLSCSLRAQVYQAQVAMQEAEVALTNADKKLRRAKRHRSSTATLETLKRAKDACIAERTRCKNTLKILYDLATPTPPETARAKPFSAQRFATL
jgi:Tfp pilus assembly protein PilX